MRSVLAALLAGALIAACSTARPDAVPPSAGAPLATASQAASVAPSLVPLASPSPGPTVTPAATPVPTPIPGTGKQTLTKYSFAITLPAGWRAIPTGGSLPADIDALIPDGSALEAALESELAKAAKEGIALLAVDLRPATLAKGLSYLTVLVAGPSTVPLSLMESLVVGLLDEAQGISSVTAKIVTLPAGQAIRAIYTITATVDGATSKYAGTAFVLLSSKHTYTVSFACPAAIASTCRSTADSIMKTFDLL